MIIQHWKPPSRWWRKYRINRDIYLGYEVQYWRVWWPFWVQPESNTHVSVEDARQYAINHSDGVVEYL